jgi:hypothetical protein
VLAILDMLAPEWALLASRALRAMANALSG